IPGSGTSVCQAILVGSVVALLYSSRACYNLVAVAISPDNVPGPFNYGWDNLSDKEYVVFGVVLFLWELVPTTFVVLFFRAQRLSQNLTPAGMVNSHSYSSRAYFFDNPRRYDSDDDLSRLGAREGGSRCGPAVLCALPGPGTSHSSAAMGLGALGWGWHRGFILCCVSGCSPEGWSCARGVGSQGKILGDRIQSSRRVWTALPGMRRVGLLGGLCRAWSCTQ
uniref:G protein-coupled receptor 137C n=1 Tax=Cyanistes caeruleus TaxID=156563 RepID=A0A8C0TZW9_CYACU